MNATRKSLEPGYEINPKTGRKIKACPPGKERGPKGNCVNIKKSKKTSKSPIRQVSTIQKTPKSSPKRKTPTSSPQKRKKKKQISPGSIKPGYEINTKTGRQIKACPPGKERGPKGNCISIKKTPKRKTPSSSPRRKTPSVSPKRKTPSVSPRRKTPSSSPQKRKKKKQISPGSIKPGYEINPKTGRQIKACPPGKERGPKGNCVSIKKSPKRKTPTPPASPKRKTPTPSPSPKRKTPTPPASPQKIKIKCSKCGKMVSKIKLSKHQESNKCINNLISEHENEDEDKDEDKDEDEDKDKAEDKDEDEHERGGAEETKSQNENHMINEKINYFQEGDEIDEVEELNDFNDVEEKLFEINNINNKSKNQNIIKNSIFRHLGLI